MEDVTIVTNDVTLEGKLHTFHRPPGLLDLTTIDEWDPNWECQRPWHRYEESKNGAKIRSSVGWVISEGAS